MSSIFGSPSSSLAFKQGKEPTTPALHCAITRSGLEIIKSGEPITGILSLSKGGISDKKISFNFIKNKVKVLTR